MLRIESTRLILRELDKSDVPFIIELLNSPGWLQYIGDRHVHTTQAAKDYISKGPATSYVLNKFGLMCVERKEDNAAIGMCGLIKREYLDAPDIGFAFLSQYSGQGYALEAAEAILKDAKERLSLEKILAICMAQNIASIKLLEKLGMHFERMIQLPDTGEELMLYGGN